MKICVVGAGAMGSVYAALFAEAGHEVWAIDTWIEHKEAINAHGLRVENASGDRTVTGIRASSEISEAGACDLYIIATKASGVGPAARAISGAAPPEAIIMTIQNGLGAGERIAEHMPTERVVLGVAEGFGASMKGPGHAHHNAMNLIRLGEMMGGLTDRLGDLEAIWQGAGFNARAFEDINQLIWEKFICNVALSASCTVFNCTVGELTANPERWGVAIGSLLEAYRCGLAEEIAFSFEDPVGYVAEFASRLADASPSMRQDHLAGRISEIDAINGMVPVVGDRHGIATPFNQTLCAVVRAREATFGR